VQLLHGDRGGGAANPCGGARDWDAIEFADPRGVLASLHHESRVVESTRDGLNATRVTGEEHIASNVALLQTNVMLATILLCCGHQELLFAR
jgi:hypothetical protein